jgi:hypothetical protein
MIIKIKIIIISVFIFFVLDVNTFAIDVPEWQRAWKDYHLMENTKYERYKPDYKPYQSQNEYNCFSINSSIGKFNDSYENYEIYSGVGVYLFLFKNKNIFNIIISLHLNISVQNSDNKIFTSGDYGVLLKIGYNFSYIFGIGMVAGLNPDLSTEDPKRFTGLKLESGIMFLSDSTGSGIYISLFLKFFSWDKNHSDSGKNMFGGQMSFLIYLR